MFGFIEILKAIAAIFITNSHFGHIWPIPAMATGGMLGDVIFFAVSGYCLYNLKQSFPIWYLKRIFRIYPVVWLVTAIALAIGYMSVSNVWDVVKLFVYPTYYHFIGSIMLLYIFYYIFLFLHHRFGVKLQYIMIAVFAAEIICYLFVFDRSVYKIDVVEDYMAKFLFMESMLAGAFFRERINNGKRNGSIAGAVIALVISVVLYFASAFAFRRYAALSQFQIISHIVTFAFVIALLNLFVLLEEKDKIRLDNPFGKLIKLLSKTTLEIYLVQYLVYYLLPSMVFPLNLVVTILLILIAALAVHFICNFITKHLNKLLEQKA